MKKISLILITVFLNMALFSCTTDTDDEILLTNGKYETLANDAEGNIPPPPPPTSTRRKWWRIMAN